MPIAQPWQLSLQFQSTQMQEGVLGYMALVSQLQQHPKPGNWVAATLVTVGTCNTVPPAAVMPMSPAPYSQQQCP